MNPRWHRSSAPFVGRIVGFVAVCSLVVAAIVYGFFSPDGEIDTSASVTTTTTASNGPIGRPAVVAAEDIKSIGPTGSSDETTSTSTTIGSDSSQNNIDNEVPVKQTTSSPSAPPTTTPTPKPSITQLVLIDARNGAVLMQLRNGSVVRRDQYPNASLSVEAYATSATESVVFSVDGNQRQLEDTPPYELNRQTRWLQRAGNYSLTAEAYSQDNAQGSVSSPFSIQLSVE